MKKTTKWGNYIKWFNEKIFGYKEDTYDIELKKIYDKTLIELIKYFKNKEEQEKLKKEGENCMSYKGLFFKKTMYQTSNGMECEDCSK